MPEPNDTSISDANAAAAAATTSKLEGAIDALVSEMRAGRAAPPVIAPVTTQPAAAPAFGPEDIDKIHSDKGLGAAFIAYSQNVLAPSLLNAAATQAKAERRAAMRDPELGKVFKRVEAKVDAYIKSRGINDSYLAQNGYDDIIRAVAAEDADIQKERIEAEVAERVKAEVAKLAPPETVAPRPAARPVEGVSSAAPRSAAPRPAPTEQAQIEAVPVSDAEAREGLAKWNLSKRDIQRGKYEVQRAIDTYGEEGIRALGGVPIASLEELGLAGGSR